MSNRRVPGLVSVIVTCYNYEKYLVEALNSIAGQTYPSLEIVLIDDASTDSSKEVAEAFARDLAKSRPDLARRFLRLRFPRNVGHAGSLTTGLFLSRGEFVAHQDADDISHPRRFEKQVAFLTHNPGVDLVGTLYAGFPDRYPDQTEPPAPWIRFGDEILTQYQRGGHALCHGTLLMRGALFDRVGGYNRRYGKAVDYEWISRLILQGVRADNIPEVLYYRRRHETQMSRT